MVLSLVFVALAAVVAVGSLAIIGATYRRPTRSVRPGRVVRCDVRGCDRPARWVSPDAGPGGLCDDHLEEV